MFPALFGFGPYIPRRDKLKAQVMANLNLATAHERRGKFQEAERFLAKAMKAEAKLERL